MLIGSIKSSKRATEKMNSQNLYKAKVSNEQDVFSFGVSIFFMCFGFYPFMEEGYFPSSFTEYLRILSRNEFCFPKSAYKLSQELKELIQAMLEKDPGMRCSWEYIFLVTKHRLKTC